VTKRLYGSGSFDISFFDSAVDRYVKNQGLIAALSGSGNIRNRLLGSSSSGKEFQQREPPLLQSARVKRKLKTIVPPPPCGNDLPDTRETAQIIAVASSKSPVEESDDITYNDGDSYRSSSGSSPPIISATSGVASMASAGTSPNPQSFTNDSPVFFTYPIFPEHFDPALFGDPRPMSSAVMAEYDRQREKAGKFRRSSSNQETDNTPTQNIRRSSAITGQLAPAVSLNKTFPCCFARSHLKCRHLSGKTRFGRGNNFHCLLYGIYCSDG
jgi:hypothetical protein